MVRVRGISYLVDEVADDVLRRDLLVIREELHCTAVMLIGREPTRGAEVALEAGLDVWVRPRLPDRPWDDVLAHLERVAGEAERLRERFPGRVTLFVGSEFSHTARGIVPGSWAYLRLMIIVKANRLLRPRITRRLDQLLDRAAATARRTFGGPLSYVAGGWETVDWSRFDLVGINLYRTGTDHAAYARRVALLVRDNDKPVVITEFGCGAFTGADRRGPGSFRIVNWFAEEPRIRDDHPRDESTQARYLGELIELYAESGVHGCFVFTFTMPDFPHREDPALDLDKAGFGVVKVPPDDPHDWTPKEAFHEVARRYDLLR